MTGWPRRLWSRRLWSRIELIAGAPIAPADVSAADLQRRIQQMLETGEPAENPSYADPQQ